MDQERTDDTVLMQAAMDYRGRGFSVIPLKSGDKTPAIPTWKEFQTRKPKYKELVSWFRDADHNIGIVTGEVSGIDVIDFDTSEAWEYGRENFPSGPTVKTGRGYQIYYRHRAGTRNFQKRPDLPGIDLRAEGGYVVAPPSLHPSGITYAWVGDGINEKPLHDLPEAILTPPIEKAGETTIKTFHEPATEGSRHDQLVKVCGSMFRDGCTFLQVIEYAEYWNTKNAPPLSEVEVEQNVRDIYNRYWKKEPGSVYDWGSAILSAEDFQTLAIPQRTSFLYPIIRESQIILCSGARGAGKTWLALSLADAISKGKGFGPWDAGESVPCLYLDGEMAAVDIKERLDMLDRGEKREQPLFFYSDAYANSLGLPRANLLNQEWRGYVRKIMIDKGVKFFVIDNLASLAAGIDENVKKDWDPINGWLIELRFQSITTLLLHHTGKEGQQRGTSAREDNIDLSLLLKLPGNYKPEDGADFIVTFSKSRLAISELQYVQDTRFTLIKGEDGRALWTHQAVRGEIKTEVLRMLNEGIKPKAIAEDLKISEARVSQIKRAAIKEGTITEDGKSRILG